MLNYLLSIPSIVYIVLIVIFTAISTIIPLCGVKLRDGRGHQKWYKGFKPAGYIVIVSVLIATAITIAKEIVTEELTSRKEKANKVIADSLARKTEMLNTLKQRENNAIIINTFVASFKKQGIKTDSAQSALENLLNENSKKTPKQIPSELILENIVDKGYQNGYLNLEFYYASNHQTAKDIVIEVIPFIDNKDKNILVYQSAILTNGATVELGIMGVLPLAIKVDDKAKSISFAQKCTWKDEDGSPHKETYFSGINRGENGIFSYLKSEYPRITKAIRKRHPKF
ncbi:hypothetical protein [Pedobacter aquatilis]|uniref:hypothetical protein n=1 Tax=Pedobacter aquatilis TaxID=351343 RepID=UPI00292FC1C7|nr:hypothetical protein [Pedobacter aquatilis]